MANNSLISILMPVRNAAAFLPDCLHSIQKQTIAHWELIAVDDHSTDNSVEILNFFRQKDDRIIVLSKDDHKASSSCKGIIPALRLAMSKCSGHYISRMDADDIMPVQKLKWLKQKLSAYGPGHISTGLVQYFSDNSLGMGYIKYQNWLNNLIKHENNFQEIYKECVIPSPCWMAYQSDLRSCGAFAPETYPEDYDLCFRFYAQGFKVVGVDQICHLWRDHPGRSSRTDERYSNQNYFDVKLPYFLQLDYDQSRPLVIWGAGTKGKQLAAMLLERNIPFHWICNNSNKIGKRIYDLHLRHFLILAELDQPQVIIAVAGPQDQKMIKTFLNKYKFKAGKDYFFFC